MAVLAAVAEASVLMAPLVPEAYSAVRVAVLAVHRTTEAPMPGLEALVALSTIRLEGVAQVALASILQLLQRQLATPAQQEHLAVAPVSVATAAEVPAPRATPARVHQSAVLAVQVEPPERVVEAEAAHRLNPATAPVVRAPQVDVAKSS